MRPLDIMKKRIQETRDNKTRAELQIEQNKKQTQELFNEVSEIAGYEVKSIEEVQALSDEKLKQTKDTMQQMAKELESVGVFTESDRKTLRDEGYL